VDDAEREARRLEAVLAERDEALRLVREQLGDKRAARRRLGDELDRLRGEADVAVADADHLRRQVEELESLLARGEASESLRAEMDSLIREIEANRVRLAERRRRTELQRRKRDEIRSDAHRARADLDVLETQAGEISGRLGDARKELKASESATQKARDQVKAAEDKLRAKEARVREIRVKIRADDARIASLTSREQGIRRTLRERRAALEEEAETALRLEALKTGQVAAGGKAASKEHGHQEGESGQIGAS
jgi:translation initiation factor IF-2